MSKPQQKLNLEQQELLSRHLAFVLDYNKQVNLTTISTVKEGLLLHVEDSLMALEELQQAPEGPLADLGSGGGFPGIPLAIATGRPTTLIESIAKKAQALQCFVDQEGLGSQITVVAQRSEEFACEARESFAVVTARAVSELPVLVELAAPLLALGGQLVCYKGQPSPEELARGRGAASVCGLIEKSLRTCFLSDGTTQRTIVGYEKVEEPSIALPRRNGMAKKRPLGTR
ncbi:MAG: 16S rRNA (guanine(527)-N(7))-methyltransferase RsmG [Coriobacteriia bacterium]|nr:16S rRNA (guanine(527)-N(7))-methyltransferase RsmG [Coriobacteriia bacterium]